MGEEWEANVHRTIYYTMSLMQKSLSLPTWNTNRHIYTKQVALFVCFLFCANVRYRAESLESK